MLIHRVLVILRLAKPDNMSLEQCQKGTDDLPANPDCQALYGAGTLFLALKLSNFDSIALFIHYNEGYAMTIKDLAAAFGSPDKLATYECHNKPRVIPPNPRLSPTGGDPKLCVNPTFHIDR